MKANPLPPLELLRELFECDFDRGTIRRRRDGKLLCGVTSRGYGYVIVARKIYPAHRVIYFMFHGVEPPIVDHIDGNKLNNSIGNLRPATALESSWNTTARGFTFRRGKKNPYNALITHRGKRHFLGSFPTAEAARNAYVRAARNLRGEFASDRLSRTL